MSKDLSTMTALIYSPVLHNGRCTMGVKIGGLMRDLGEKVKLGRIAHQEYYIIIDRLSQAEMAKSVSHNDFTRKPDKGGCEEVRRLVGDGYSCVVIHGGINKYGVERTAKLSTFLAAVHCRSHEAGRYAASFISRRK